MQVIRALHTPLQDVTFGSGCRLKMQTYNKSKKQKKGFQFKNSKQLQSII